MRIWKSTPHKNNDSEEHVNLCHSHQGEKYCHDKVKRWCHNCTFLLPKIKINHVFWFGLLLLYTQAMIKKKKSWVSVQQATCKMELFLIPWTQSSMC